MRLLASLGLLLALSCGGPPPGPGGPGGPGAGEADRTDPRVLVEAVPVERGSVADELVTTGTIESEAQADIVPETNGVVTRILVEEGDRVRRGQVLAVIANPSLDANADRAEIELARARRAVEQARSLHASGALSDQELDDAEAAWQTAQATYEEATRTRGFTQVRSPIDGTVAIREVRLGEVAGGKRAFQVVDLDRLRVVVRLPEKDLPRVRPGQPVRLEGAYDPDATATGRVQRVSPVVDPTTGTVRVTIAVDRPDDGPPRVRPGQYARVRIEVDRHDDVLTIPKQALVWVDGEPVAWTVEEAPPEEQGEAGAPDEAADEDDDGPGLLARLFGREAAAEEAEEAPDPWAGVPRRVAKRHRLTLGYTDAERVEVVEGLAEGDLVITAGNTNLREDARLRLPGDPDPAWPDAPGEDGADDEPGDEAGGDAR